MIPALITLLVGCTRVVTDGQTVTPEDAQVVRMTEMPHPVVTQMNDQGITPLVPATSSTPSNLIIPETPTQKPRPTGTATSSVTVMPSGPDGYPKFVNPLSGLPVNNAANLDLPPALVSISNSPVTTRPQSGLSYSPLVFEYYLGEGASRFLAVFYGDYPPMTIENPDGELEKVAINPIRSGRLPYESLRQLYHGFLVFAGASELVLPHLTEYHLVLNEDLANINGARIDAEELLELAYSRQKRLGEPEFSGLQFDPVPPEGGKNADSLWVAIHYNVQVFWRYDENQGAYFRYQDSGPGTPLVSSSDRINGDPLTFENVVVLFAEYHRWTETWFDIDLQYIKRHPALLFRNGQMYEIYWTTRNQEYEYSTGKLRPIRFVDYDGKPIALKPGQTWVEIVQVHSPYYETAASEDYWYLSRIKEPGSGHWAVMFYPPAFEPIEDKDGGGGGE